MIPEEIELEEIIFTELIIVGIGIFLLSLVVPSFTISRMLRSHPGSLILGISICEIIRYYEVFWLLLLLLLKKQDYGDGFDLFAQCAHLIDTLSLGFITLTSGDLVQIALSTLYISLRVMLCYYFFLAIDLILLLRNPFYSPGRRSLLYHLISILVPLCIFFPLYILTSKIYIYIYIYVCMYI